MLLGVKGKVLGNDSKKILRPDPGLYSQYFPSYDIFCETRIFRHPFSTWFCTRTKNEKKFGYHKKWHNSESIVSTDLGQVSKFSLVQYLKLFLWHPKDLVSRKNVLKGRRKKNIFFGTPFRGKKGRKNVPLNSSSQYYLNSNIIVFTGTTVYHFPVDNCKLHQHCWPCILQLKRDYHHEIRDFTFFSQMYSA